MSAETSIGGTQVRFQNTLWTLLLRAKEGEDRKGALDQLLRLYWKPVYFYVRRRGHAVEDAKDLTQAFFATFLEKDFIRSFSRGRGRFRTFLLAAVTHFLAKEYRKGRAIRRGGAIKVVPLDFEDAEREFAGTKNEAPEAVFDREWALALIQGAFARLRQEEIERGRGDEFRTLEPFLTKDDAPYTELASQLRSTPRQVSRTMYILRTRFKATLRSLVSDTVASDEDFRWELSDFARFFRTEPGPAVT